MKKSERALIVSKILEKTYPETPIPLDHSSIFRLLVAVLLSAQCTDERVNKVTPSLFKIASSPLPMSKLSEETIYKIIKPCGLGPKKSKAIKELSTILVKKFGEVVPSNFEELEKLPGVGHKTASVVMSQGFGVPAFAVDTHIHRLAQRWGLTNGKNVKTTEADLKKLFPNQVNLLHGKTSIEEKEIILNKFLKNDFKILVSTTIIEVGIDFPNANVIVIENANKFGLSQLHQLRGRVGRGNKESSCILLFKSNLSDNARKRINILKDSNDGFEISEEDMKLRGFGDILGFKQSGIKNFKLADPIHNHDLFILAEEEIKRIENAKEDISRFKPLLKLYDRADIINDIA